MKPFLICAIASILLFAGACSYGENHEQQTNLEQPANLNQVLKVYREFLDGSLIVEKDATVGHISISDIFCYDDEDNEYALYDSNNDNLPDLHLSTPRFYYIISVEDGNAYFLYSGNGYDTLLNDGTILMTRPGGAPSHIDYCHTWFDGNGGSIYFSQYDTDNTFIYDKSDNKYIYDGAEITKSEYTEYTSDILSMGSNIPIWVAYSRENFLS